MLREHHYEWNDIAIGGSLNAITYATLYGSKILSLDYTNVFPFDTFVSEYDLGINGVVQKGSAKYELLDILSYKLASRGHFPPVGNLLSLRVDPEGSLLTGITEDKSEIKIKYKNLRIFDSRGVAGIPFDWHDEIREYRVFDWFDVRSGTRHSHDLLEDDDNYFVKRIFFYLSERIDGNKEYKDLVSESLLIEEELHNPDYSDSLARLKVMSMMRNAGIKGTSNGVKQFLPINIQLYKREIIPIKDTEFKRVGNITIDNRTEEEVMDEWISSSRHSASRRATS